MGAFWCQVDILAWRPGMPRGCDSRLKLIRPFAPRIDRLPRLFDSGAAAAVSAWRRRWYFPARRWAGRGGGALVNHEEEGEVSARLHGPDVIVAALKPSSVKAKRDDPSDHHGDSCEVTHVAPAPNAISQGVALDVSERDMRHSKVGQDLDCRSLDSTRRQQKGDSRSGKSRKLIGT